MASFPSLLLRRGQTEWMGLFPRRGYARSSYHGILNSVMPAEIIFSNMGVDALCCRDSVHASQIIDNNLRSLYACAYLDSQPSFI